jgi:hypothetical protein
MHTRAITANVSADYSRARPGHALVFRFVFWWLCGNPILTVGSFKGIAGGDGTYGDVRCSTNSARTSHLQSPGGLRQA